MRMFDVHFSYFRTNKQLSMLWPSGSRARRASGRIKGRARASPGAGALLVLGRQELRVGRDGGGGGGGCRALGVQRCRACPTQAPQGSADGPADAHGASGADNGAYSRRGSGAGSVAVSELLGASPVDASEPRGHTATCLGDVFCVPVCGRPWVSGPLRACPSRPPAQRAQAACSVSQVPPVTGCALGLGAGRERQGCPETPTRAARPGLRAQQSEGTVERAEAGAGDARNPH